MSSPFELMLNTLVEAGPLFNACIVAVLAYMHLSYFITTRRPLHGLLGVGWLGHTLYLALENQSLRPQAFAYDLVVVALFLAASRYLSSNRVTRTSWHLAGWALLFLSAISNLLLVDCPWPDRCWERYILGSTFTSAVYITIGLSILRTPLDELIDLFGRPDAITEGPEEAKRDTAAPGSLLDKTSATMKQPEKALEIDTYVQADHVVAKISLRGNHLAEVGQRFWAGGFVLYGFLQLAYPLDVKWSLPGLFLVGMVLKISIGAGIRYLIAAQGKRTDALLRKAEIEAELAKITASVEHDMRGPLHELDLVANLLSERSELERYKNFEVSKFLKEQAKNIEELEARARTVMGMIIAMRADPEEIRKSTRKVHIGSPLKRAMRTCKTAHGSSSTGPVIRLSGVDATMKVECSPMRLTQVFLNLLNNAVEATMEKSPGTRPYVWIFCKKVKVPGDPGRFVSVTVRDEGVGVKEEHLRILDKAYFSTKKGPLSVNRGMGLYVVKRMIQIHGGSFSINSEFGKWTEATVCLPLA